MSTGDRKAFRELFNKYHRRIFAIALKITGVGETAEDVVQEVFIKLWMNKEKLPAIENFNAYLNTVTRNHIFNKLRKLAHEQIALQKLIAQQTLKEKSSSDQIVYNELEKLIHNAVAQLPSQQKKVYTLSRVYGLKHEEIAQQLGISSSTVKGHIVHALQHIKSFLRANGELVILFFILQTFL
jgi:RNA polymerase sigma-70 factor (ECF subfamily)